MNNFKDKIQKNFDKEENYNIILSKIERRNRIKKKKLNYVLAFSFIILALLIGVSVYAIPKNNNKIIKARVELNINKADEKSMMKFDADVANVLIDTNSEIYKEFPFLTKTIKTPTDLTNYGISYAIMTKQKNIDKKYNVIHDYIWEYKNKTADKTIRIAFSKIGEPIRDYFLSSKQIISKIEDTEVIITQYEDLYLAEFKIDDVYFDIETARLTQTELVDLLVSIVE